MKAITRKSELERELKKIIEIIKEKYLPEKIILFGSLASGEINEYSDIDLLIIKKTDKKYWDRIDEFMSIVHPEEPLDVFIFTPEELEENVKKENPYILEILNKGKVIYERENRELD